MKGFSFECRFNEVKNEYSIYSSKLHIIRNDGYGYTWDSENFITFHM